MILLDIEALDEREARLAPGKASFITGFKHKLDQILYMDKPEHMTQLPYMGHNRGTIIELAQRWGKLKPGPAMFIGLHNKVHRSWERYSPEELGYCHLCLEIADSTLENTQGEWTHKVRVYWVQEWLQEDNLIRENVPWLLYGMNHREGTSGKDPHVIRS